jgi:hypothetical protein
MMTCLPHSWAMTCGLSGAPPMTGKSRKAAVDSGRALGAVGSALEGV